MSIREDFEEIIKYAHFWNWQPDWYIVKETYQNNPDSYSVLTPFAYAYLEELIRTTTSEYGLPLFHNNKPIKLKVGMSLMKLAKEENQQNVDYINLLNKLQSYFDINNLYDGNGRNKVLHGHLHPRFWTKEDFEKLIHDIATLSLFSKF